MDSPRRSCFDQINERVHESEFITRTGPRTPMGQLLRRYWAPVLLAEELPANACPPVRVKVLSERMVAFRDSNGPYGLIDEFCPHRGVSLWFGRNETDRGGPLLRTRERTR
jgi:phthalate 4,5-dioxygenase oxygenase subunit